MTAVLEILKLPAVGHALRLALASAIAVLLGKALEISHLFWVLLTLPLVLPGQAGDSLRLSAKRLAGTMIGALGALGLALAVGAADRLWLLPVLPILMIVIPLYMPVMPILGASLVTMMVVLGFAILTGQPAQAASARVVDTLLAVAIAVAVTLLVVPQRASSAVDTALPQLWRDVGSHYRQVLRVLTLGGQAPQDCDLRPFMAAQQELTQRLASARWETLPWSRNAARNGVTARVIASLAIHLAALQGLLRPNPLPNAEAILPLFDSQAERIAAAMQQIAAGLEAEGKQPVLPDIAAIRGLVEATTLQALALAEEGSGTPLDEDMRRRLVVIHCETGAILDDLERFASAVLR